jgi:hypothetical protein
MDRTPGLSLLLLLALAPLASWSQDLPSPPKAGGKVCVALVSNTSASSVLENRMTDRLSKALKDSKISTLTMDSSTTTDRKLHLTAENGHEAKSKECDYILLTQVVDPKAHPDEPRIPAISIGGRVPSTDASDPLGGSSGPVYRDNLQISFALFRTDRFKPVLDAAILAPPSGNVSDNLLSAMDREANRIGHELKKK